jgi:hypothetical protein
MEHKATCCLASSRIANPHRELPLAQEDTQGDSFRYSISYQRAVKIDLKRWTPKQKRHHKNHFRGFQSHAEEATALARLRAMLPTPRQVRQASLRNMGLFMVLEEVLCFPTRVVRRALLRCAMEPRRYFCHGLPTPRPEDSREEFHLMLMTKVTFL